MQQGEFGAHLKWNDGNNIGQMDIIVVSRNRQRTWRLALTPRNVLLWAPLILVLSAIMVGTGTLGWLLRGIGPGPAASPELVELWAQQVADQREELAQAKALAEQNTRALSQKVAQLQAHVMRLDAAGHRMTEVAGLDADEFSFDSAPAVGGPEVAEERENFDGDPVLGALEAFERKLQARERQMRVVEDILMAGRLQRELKPSGWPVVDGYVSSIYGWRADPFNGRRALHTGIDFAAPAGAEVLAVAAGIVTEALAKPGYGRMVEINHGNGYVTRYGHNQRLLVKAGQKVGKGQKIATVGSSGRATGPHVHFEVLLNGYMVNPAQYIRAAQ